MIAKPTKYTLPLAILLVIILTFLGWLFNAGKGQVPSNGDPSSENESNTSQARPSRESSRAQRTSSLKPANIDVRKRLDALYAQYPELAIPVKDPEKSLVALYEGLFPYDDNSALHAKLEAFEVLLKKEAPWTEGEKQSAIDFLAKEQERLNVMMNHTDSSYHFQNSNGVVGYQSYLFPALRLLATSFALEAKLGNVDQAERTYRSSSEELPERISQLLLENSNSTADFKEILKGEFASSLELPYRLADRNDRGEVVIEGNSEIYEILMTDLEETMAAIFLEKIHQVQEFELSPRDYDSFIKSLNTPTLTGVSSNEKFIQDILFSGYGLYYDTVQKFSFITEARQTAIKIALAQSRGETFTGKLPNHYKTSQPIVWDQENNILHTGIEAEENQDFSTIKIPKIKF